MSIYKIIEILSNYFLSYILTLRKFGTELARVSGRFNSEDEASTKKNFDQPSGEFMIMRFTFQVLVPSKSIVNTTVAMKM